MDARDYLETREVKEMIEALRQQVIEESKEKGYCQVKWNSRVLEAKSVVGRT